MILHEVNLGEKFDEIELIPISDVHIGDAHFDEKLIKKDIDYIKEKKNRFAVLNGDIMNTATTHSVSDTYSNTLTPHGELKYARKLFKPIADKILAVTQGNHERRIMRNDGVDMSEELAFSLGSFYKQEGLILKIKFGDRGNGKPQVYTAYITHGSSGASLPGGKLNKLYKMRNIVVADLYITGHVHEKETLKKDLFIPDLRNKKVVRKTQTFVSVGAYLDYGGYGQIKTYHPGTKGTVKIKMYAKEKNIETIY